MSCKLPNKSSLNKTSLKNLHVKTLGRPPGDHDLRKLRSAIWYQAVKSVDNLNDSKLDLLFGSGEGDERKTSSDRIKIFEAIRVNRSIPNSGNKSRRKFDLVERVDSHFGYKGTASIIHSPLWQLLGKKALSIKELREMVLQCILNLDSTNETEYLDAGGPNFLTAVEFADSNLFLEGYFEQKSEADNKYHMAMASTFRNFELNLDYIALLGALSYEAIAAGNMVAAASLVKSLRILLKEYCEQDWLGNLGDELYEFVVMRIRAVLNKDNLNDLPSYILMLSNLSNANNAVLNSPIARFLQLHERTIWRKQQ